MRLISHNTVSVDGAVTGFPVDIALHYQLAGTLGGDLTLVGSETARSGVEQYMGAIPREVPEDLMPRSGADSERRSLWAIPDSTGRLHGLMHVYRRFEGARDVVVFVAEATPQAYVDYLAERRYRYHVVGAERVDLREMLRVLEHEYGGLVGHVDSGGGLTHALLAAGLLDEVSLVVAPALAGEGGLRLFRDVTPTEMERTALEALEAGAYHIRYRVRQ